MQCMMITLHHNSDSCLQASPLPRAAHIGVSWVQRAAQSNQDAKKQQDGRALQGRHGPEGKEKQRHMLHVWLAVGTSNSDKSEL